MSVGTTPGLHGLVRGVVRGGSCRGVRHYVQVRGVALPYSDLDYRGCILGVRFARRAP